MPTTNRRHLKRYETRNQPRFLTFSCHHRLALFNNDRIKKRCVEYFAATLHTLRYDLIAWVIMPEHVHLLLTPDLPSHPVSRILEAIKGEFAKEVLARWRSCNAPILQRLEHEDGRIRFWQRGGGYDRNIRDEQELYEKCDYIHNNPCKRGLVDSPTDWPWSSARYYAGRTRNILDI